MQLRGTDFGHVLNASGARGFFGEGYPFHAIWRPFGLRYDGSTFVAKTMTLSPREGNMPLREDGLTPRERLPSCIVVRPSVALNAVGLSNRGAAWLLDQGRWQARTEPFFLSFMSLGKDAAERREELHAFTELLAPRLREFRAPVGLKINFSCPNVGIRHDDLVSEVRAALDIAAPLGIPLVPKFNALLPVEAALHVQDHDACDAICMGNTLPWGTLPSDVPWKELFGSESSPLAHLGGGGLSGAPLRTIHLRWIFRARAYGFTKPIIGLGGVLSKDDAHHYLDTGASAVSLGSVSILRPWRVASIIRSVTTRYRARGEERSTHVAAHPTSR